MRSNPSPSRGSLHRSVRLFFGGHNRAIVDFSLCEFRYRTSVFKLRIVQVPPSNGLSSASRSCRAHMSQDLSSKTPPPLTSHVTIGMSLTGSSAQSKPLHNRQTFARSALASVGLIASCPIWLAVVGAAPHRVRLPPCGLLKDFLSQLDPSPVTAHGFDFQVDRETAVAIEELPMG